MDVRAPCILALALFTLGAQGSGSHDHRHGHTQLEAHEHGHGVLNIAFEGEELVLELRVPGVNVVGFEHEPSTPEQHERIDKALHDFGEANELFATPVEAKCKVEDVKVRLAGEEGGDHAGHKEHAHDKEHKSEKHDEHGHGEKEEHSELHAEYHFHCHEPDQLDRVEVKVFAYLLDADEIEANVVTHQMQTQIELTAKQSMVRLRP